MMKLKVRDLVEGYHEDDNTSKVTAWNGQLDVRPEYQREYVYDDQKRDSVINTVLNGFPLNIMYFVDRGENAPGARYEVLDGQQRIISICRFKTLSAISVKLPAPTGGYNIVNFPNLFDELQEAFLDYELQVYICEGTKKEQLEWFKTINIAGEKFTDQELRNAIYTGEWLTEAKRYFSKTSCPAYQIGEKYLTGTAIRQDYLETALRWIADRDGITIPDYMSIHQHDKNANDIWMYFQSVISWVKVLFPNYRKEMKGIDWGLLYNKYHNNPYDAKELEADYLKLLDDDEVQSTKGIYLYLFTGEEKHLSLRAFDEKTKRKVYEKQKGLCAMCGKPFDITGMEADHIDPWHDGGRTVIENCQMLCRHCNRIKSGN